MSVQGIREPCCSVAVHKALGAVQKTSKMQATLHECQSCSCMKMWKGEWHLFCPENLFQQASFGKVWLTSFL